MEKIQITQENDLIKIGKVVLTKDAITTLENLQDNSDHCLNDYIEALGNAVCFLARTQFHFGLDYETLSQSLIADLSFIHGDLKYLKNPTEKHRPTKIEKDAIEAYINSPDK